MARHYILLPKYYLLLCELFFHPALQFNKECTSRKMKITQALPPKDKGGVKCQTGWAHQPQPQQCWNQSTMSWDWPLGGEESCDWLLRCSRVVYSFGLFNCFPTRLKIVTHNFARILCSIPPNNCVTIFNENKFIFANLIEKCGETMGSFNILPQSWKMLVSLRPAPVQAEPLGQALR